ncbi:hypothetical protein GCM10009760_03640 [Kitasatospora kazusensis]|uniref:Uncharacterized protein n=1 Tax=Kitasatospora kazusensis TaxID=407974 RepID=A0ABN2YQ20_9ACTN
MRKDRASFAFEELVREDHEIRVPQLAESRVFEVRAAMGDVAGVCLRELGFQLLSDPSYREFVARDRRHHHDDLALGDLYLSDSRDLRKLVGDLAQPGVRGRIDAHARSVPAAAVRRVVIARRVA